MKYLHTQNKGCIKTTLTMAMAYALLTLGSAKAAEIPLVTTDTGTDTGWVAITNDTDSIVFTSITIPKPNNMMLHVDANVSDQLHIRFKQVEVTSDFGGSGEEAETFLFIEGAYKNTGTAAWTGAQFDSRDGLGRTISIQEADDHPDAIHYHGPVNAHATYNSGDSLFNLDGLWNPVNHPFGEIIPVQDPDFGHEIGLGVKSVTLCSNSIDNSVAPNDIGNFSRQRLHIKNPKTAGSGGEKKHKSDDEKKHKFSDDGLSEAEKKALEKAKEMGSMVSTGMGSMVSTQLVSFDYWFNANPVSCN